MSAWIGAAKHELPHPWQGPNFCPAGPLELIRFSTRVS